MIWLICGGRDFSDQEMFDRVMRSLVSERGLPDAIIHGGCPSGGDRMAEEWAERFYLMRIVVRADWDLHGKKAGPIRNASMLTPTQIAIDREPEAPELVIAFPGGRGTTDMATKALAAGVETVLITTGGMITKMGLPKAS